MEANIVKIFITAPQHQFYLSTYFRVMIYAPFKEVPWLFIIHTGTYDVICLSW